MKVELYVDGAASLNGQEGAIAGWGWCLLINDEKIAENSGWIDGGTNNQGELQSIIEGLCFIYENAKNLKHPITVYSDSSYCIKGITEWIFNWKKYNWSRNSQGTSILKNKEYWQKLDEISQKLNITWKWVKGHTDNYWNNYADKLATDAVKERKNG